eukprot:713467_1
MSGVIHCEFPRDKSFEIGYFNDPSRTSYTSIKVVMAKRAILEKLDLLENNKHMMPADVRLINRTNGLEYRSDEERIKSNTIVMIKLKPTTRARSLNTKR